MAPAKKTKKDLNCLLRNAKAKQARLVIWNRVRAHYCYGRAQDIGVKLDEALRFIREAIDEFYLAVKSHKSRKDYKWRRDDQLYVSVFKKKLKDGHQKLSEIEDVIHDVQRMFERITDFKPCTLINMIEDVVNS